jgi:hypothetical protein
VGASRRVINIEDSCSRVLLEALLKTKVIGRISTSRSISYA